MKYYEIIIHIDNNYYGYNRTSNMIPIYEEDYGIKWDIDFLGSFENKNDVKILFPQTSIKSIDKAQHQTIKFVIDKIKEINDRRTIHI